MIIESTLKKVLVVFGTRPEAIKMAPVIQELQGVLNVKICVTAQHREMLDQVLELFQIIPDYDLNVMKSGQDLFDITSNVLLKIRKILRKECPDLLLVHGDTTTTMASAMAAFYMGIPVGHIEAGLRTNNMYSPYPEEFNRQVVTRIAKLHFAPTQKAKENLLNERVPEENVYVTGNTVIDALFSTLEKAKDSTYSSLLLDSLPFMKHSKIGGSKIILVTGHRRENFGKGFEDICQALREIALTHSDIHIVYPVHLNPNVRGPVNRVLSDINNVYLIEPLDYLPFVKLMNASYFILTDSGGIQEEAPSLGKPILVMRDTTERPEAVAAGVVQLVGTNKDNIINTANKLILDLDFYEKMSSSVNPYGDGFSSKKICQILSEVLV